MPKTIRFHETGGASVLKFEDLPLAEPGQGEVRLKVEAIGLNRAEVMFREGQYLETPELPSRLGYEAAGVGRRSDAPFSPQVALARRDSPRGDTRSPVAAVR